MSRVVVRVEGMLVNAESIEFYIVQYTIVLLSYHRTFVLLSDHPGGGGRGGDQVPSAGLHVGGWGGHFFSQKHS